MSTTPNMLGNIMTGDYSNVARGQSATGGTIPGANSNMLNTTGTGATTSGLASGAAPYSALNTGVATVPGATTSNGETVGTGAGALNLTGQQQSNVTKQLTDTYGKGEGALLGSEISNLGSSDNSYMQAYTAAMAPQNAENLSSLNTTLGNEGVSGNSSTAAIADADFNSNVTSQEGLQEAQLQQTSQQDLLGLTSGLEGQSAAEVSSGGFLNDLGSIAGSVAELGSGIANVATGGLSGIASSAAGMLSNSSGSDPLGLNSTATVPSTAGVNYNSINGLY
jgi:hypothetical protein